MKAVISVTRMASALAVGIALFALPIAAQEEEHRVEVKIKKRAIFLNNDGEVIELVGEGDGHSFAWSHDGKVIQLDGGAGPHVFLTALGLGRGFLGVEMTPLTNALREYFGVEEGVGVMIADIREGSPAELAGLEVGDIVTLADHQEVRSPSDLSRIVRSKEKDELLDLEVWRRGHPLSLTVTVRERARPVIKLGRNGEKFEVHLEHLGAAAEDGVVLRIDEAMGQMKDYFEGDEWKDRVRRFESADWVSIEVRMEEVQRQLRELEKRLKERDPDGEL